MAKHSSIGASSCYRWWNCPGSVTLCADIPAPPPGKYAQEGTTAHELADRAWKEQVDPRKLVGTESSNGLIFTSEMAKHVQFYLNTIMEDLVNEGMTHEDLHFETKFNLKDIDPDAFGTCDAYFAVPFGKLYVYDLKYGAGVPVEAVGNLQMQYYALGARELSVDVEEIEMVIVQPRVEEKVKRWTVGYDDMDKFAGQLKTHVMWAKDPKSDLQDGTWCKWCPALATCPQVSKKVVEVAQREFQSVKPLPEPGALTLPQLKLVLEKAELLTDWVASVEVYAKTLLEAGTKIEGWKLVPKRAHRKWRDEFEVETALADVGEAMYEKKLKTPKQMESVIGKERVAELSETPDNGLTLARDKDERVEAKSDFDVIAKAMDAKLTEVSGIETVKPKRKYNKKQELF